MMKMKKMNFKVILGEGLRFGEETYHPDCFNCSQCQTPLNQVTNCHHRHHDEHHNHHDDHHNHHDHDHQGSFHAIKGRPVCGPCNELQFQETCAKCGDTVSGDCDIGDGDVSLITIIDVMLVANVREISKHHQYS